MPNRRLPYLVGPPDFDDWIAWRRELEEEREAKGEKPVRGKIKKRGRGLEPGKHVDHRYPSSRS